jgi:uncharacterized protein
MFVLKIDDIPDEGLELKWEEGTESMAAYLKTLSRIDFSFESPLHSEAKIQRVGKTILIKGSVQTILRFQCARCLKEFSYPLSSNLDITLLPSEGVSVKEGEGELTDEEMELTYHDGEEIHLSEIACEQVFLEVPYQPLCHAECKGLCQICGTNLNLSTCRCVQEGAEGSFKILQKLKLDQKNEES